MSKCIIRTIAKRVARGLLECIGVIIGAAIFIGMPTTAILLLIDLSTRYLGERTTALLGLAGFLVALIACIICNLIKLYREAKEECK